MNGMMLRRNLAEAAAGNQVAREWSARGRGTGADGGRGIVDDLRNLAEVALRLKAGGNGVHDRRTGATGRRSLSLVK